MSLTRHRTFQYVGILFSLMLIAVGYWYFAVRAGVKTNTGGTQPQGVGDLSAGLVGYWKLDEGTGTSASDASVNESTGTLTNGPTWTTGQIGGAVNLDGTNDYITDPGATAVDIRGSISLATWVKFDALPTSGQGVTLIYNEVSGNHLYRFRLLNVSGSYVLRFAAGGGTDADDESSALSVTTGTWYHLMVGYDSVGDRVYFYLNGSDVGQQIETVTGGYAGGTGTLYFGALAGTSQFVDGQIDEVRIYDRVLSSGEAASLYRLTTPTAVDTGLKGYWSFNGDAVSGTTAYDWSGSGNHGTLTNGPSTTDGRIGQALNFDGSNDYVDAVANSSALAALTQASIAFWINPRAAGYQGGIFSTLASDGGGNGPFGSGFMVSGDIWAGTQTIRFVADGSTGDMQTRSTSALPLNSWTHVVVVWNGSLTAADTKFYINGELDKTTGMVEGSGSFVPSSGNFHIGRMVASYTLDGALDEFRVYNRILTAAEIKSLYDRSAPDRTNTSATQLAGAGDLASGLAGYWKLDENTGTSAADASVNGNNGTLTNGPTWTTGQIGSAVDFDGTNDHINAGTADGLVLTDRKTVAAWIYISGTMVNGDVYEIARKYSSGDSNGYYGFGLFHNGSAPVLYSWQGGGGANIYSTGTLTAGRWYHVAATFDKPTVSFYIDGRLDSTGTDTVAGGYPSGSGTMFIGSTSGGGYFNGNIDELRVYDRPLSAVDIANLYRLTAPTGVDTSLRGYWSFNGDAISGTTAYDWSGTGNNGTINGGPLVKGGRVGQALSFDNSDDYVLAGSPSTVDNLETQGGGGLTASAWIYPESGGTFGGSIVGKRAAPGPGDGDWAFTMHQDGDAIKFFKSYSTTNLEAMTNSGSIELNRWQFVTVTWSGTAARTSVSFYIDGVLVPTSTSGGTDGVGTKDSDASESVSISSQFYQYDGLIDEVRLYNRILSAAEIKSLYDRSAPDKTNTSISTPQGTGRLDSGLAGYWKLDDGSGTSAADASTNGNNGTLTNGPTWTTGQIGGAVNLDGTNDYVTIGDANSLNITKKLTLSAWIKKDTHPSAGSGHTILSKGSFGLPLVNYYLATYATGPSTERLEFGFVDSGNTSHLIYGSTNIDTGSWHLATAVYDDDEDSIRLYLDGALQENTVRSGTPETASLVINGSAIQIGVYGSGVYPFDGQIDEVRVYNRALSPDEVGQLYRLATPTGTDTGLKGYWSFNGPDLSGTTAYDRSGTGNNGTLTNGPTVKWGKIGQALEFDGSNDYVTMGDIAAFDGMTAMTASAWVRTTALTGVERHIVDKAACTGATDSGTFELWHSTSDTGKPSFTFYKNGGSPADYRATSSVEIDDGGWHLVTGTYDGAAVRIYVDGVETGSTTAISITSPSTANAVEVGGRCNGNPFYWLGGIDEVRLYNRALPASEIKALYASGK